MKVATFLVHISIRENTQQKILWSQFRNDLAKQSNWNVWHYHGFRPCKPDGWRPPPPPTNPELVHSWTQDLRCLITVIKNRPSSTLAFVFSFELINYGLTPPPIRKWKKLVMDNFHFRSVRQCARPSWTPLWGALFHNKYSRLKNFLLKQYTLLYSGLFIFFSSTGFLDFNFFIIL